MPYKGPCELVLYERSNSARADRFDQSTFRELRSWRHDLYVQGIESGLNENSVRQRLKRETAAVHQHLEAQLGLLDPGLDVPRYLRVLGTFYGFYVPVEIDVTDSGPGLSRERGATP